jgi:phosphate transport system substrate-binding protein
MVSDFNYVTCPKCGHDRNPSTAQNCEICAQPLKPGFKVPPIVWIGLAVLGAIGAGGYLFKDKLLKPETTATISPNGNGSSSAPGIGSSSQPTSNTAPISGAVVQVYSSLKDVPNVPTGTFNYGGSTSFAYLRTEGIVQVLEDAHPGFQLRYTEPPNGKPGSGEGIQMLLDGELSFAQSSRPIKDEEYAKAKNRGFALEQIPVAIDGIAFYVNPKIGVQGLSLAQVKAIFTGTITNWKELGGPDQAIVPVSRDQQAGGTVDYVVKEVLGGASFSPSVVPARDTTASIRAVGTTPGGIGYATAAEVIGQQMVRPIALGKHADELVAPYSDNAQSVNRQGFEDGTYPLTRRLFIVLRRDGQRDEQAGVAYTNMFLSDDGQRLIEKAGFVPLRPQ